MSCPIRSINRSWRLAAAVTAAAIFSFTAHAHACGPFFPNDVIINGDRGVLTIPAGVFEAEMNRLRPAGEPPFKAVRFLNKEQLISPVDLTQNIDLAELQTALNPLGGMSSQQAATLNDYRQVRHALADYSNAIESQSPTSRPAPPAVTIPTGLPGEFEDYLRGAIAFGRGDFNGARRSWTELMQRPAAQRHYRSTWAVFMLGKLSMHDDPAFATAYLRQTRALAQEGFADGLGLASSSLGWEAQLELKAGHFPAAIHLYMQQFWTGDSTACESLQLSAQKALAGESGSLSQFAGDELSREVITSYLLCRGGKFSNFGNAEKSRVPQWLAAVESVAVPSMPSADRLAWAAYEHGEFETAGRWAARANSDSPIAHWVQAKLLLRHGEVQSAAAVLAKSIKSFPPDSQWLTPEGNEREAPGVPSVDNVLLPMVGDAAMLDLTRGQYVDALNLFLRADDWLDAAYIAERVLTADELKKFVDDHFHVGENHAANIAEPSPMDRFSTNSAANRAAEPQELRCLLARRLTRNGRRTEARAYFPEPLRTTLTTYATAIDDGNDAKRSDEQRAASLALAAHLSRDHGMELLGTELAPDFSCWQGHYAYGPDRFGEAGAAYKLTAPSADEAARFNSSGPAFDHRYHYRYIAADYAWQAAALMPDDADATAALLNEAGSWLKDKDALAADRFYKALVRRCPSTAIARQAADLHWFVPLHSRTRA